MTIGLAPGKVSSLVLDVRRQAVADWDNETLFSSGWRSRSASTMERGGFGFL